MRLAPLVLLLATLPLHAAIFGADDRESITAGSRSFAFSRSTAVAVLSSNIEPTAVGKLKLNLDDLSQMFCPSVRFARSQGLSYACTGFLVGPDLIATAGHCMVNTGNTRNETEMYCKAYSWLFDYRQDVNSQNIDPANHYKCKKIIYAVKDERAPFRDFALVQLERPVTGRTPYKISTTPVSRSNTFSMLGHPFGMPMKRSVNARLLVNTLSRQSFLTSLDAFWGNSGSPVFNEKEEIVGILVGGTPSANTVTTGRCDVLNRCSDSGTNCLENDSDTSIFPGYQGIGSEVQRIAPIAQLMRQLRSSSR